MASRFRLVMMMAIGISILGCARNAPELAKARVENDEQTRPYYYHVPGNAPADELLPLVVVLHGFGQTPAIIARETGFNEIADREGFFVAYARGIRRGFDPYDDMNRDDVGYIRELVAAIQEKYPVDPTRIYAVGSSNGGFMTFRLACEATELFAAVATVMALMPRMIAEERPPDLPMPVLMIHGTEDPVIPYDADQVWRVPWKKRSVLPIEETVAYWVEHNKCDPVPEAEPLSNREPDDGTHTTRTSYKGGKNATEVVLYTVHGGGHTWPGSADPFVQRIAGRRSMDFCASEVIWEFFQRHTRPHE